MIVEVERDLEAELKCRERVFFVCESGVGKVSESREKYISCFLKEIGAGQVRL